MSVRNRHHPGFALPGTVIDSSQTHFSLNGGWPHFHFDEVNPVESALSRVSQATVAMSTSMHRVHCPSAASPASQAQSQVQSSRTSVHRYQLSLEHGVAARGLRSSTERGLACSGSKATPRAARAEITGAGGTGVADAGAAARHHVATTAAKLTGAERMADCVCMPDWPNLHRDIAGGLSQGLSCDKSAKVTVTG